MNTTRFLFVWLILAALWLSCGNSSEVLGIGNSSEANGTVVGKLVRSDGKTPAANVRVTMRLCGSLPVIPLQKSLADSASVMSDPDGNFRFDTNMIDPGTYVLEAVSLDMGVGMIDSVVLRADDSTNVEDTLKAPGAIRGTIILPEGGDLRKTFVGIFGLGRMVGTDSNGVFLLPMLGEGAYTLRLISVLDMYGVVDTSGIKVTSGDTTLLGTIMLPFTGVPSPKNLTADLDIAGRSVVLRWAAGRGVDGYRVYRNHADSGYAKIGPNIVKDTFYVDTGAQPSTSYKYQVMAVDANNSESIAGSAIVVKTDSLLLWPRTVIHDFGATGLQDIRVCDLDNDQDEDILATVPNNGNGPAIVWLENNQGVFVQHTVVDTLAGFFRAFAPTVTDINQDGSGDILAVLDDQHTCWLYWFKNDGARHFTPIKIDSLGVFSSAITIAFMQNFDREAIVPTISGVKGCTWFDYVNDTTFTRRFAPVCISTNTTLVADFDRDGDNDFYMQNFYDAHAYWYENRGDTAYVEHLIDNAAPEADGAQAMDFDADGDIDIIARSSGGLFLYRNDGAGTFTESGLAPATDIGSLCVAIDLLGSGRIDLVVTQNDGAGASAIGWYQKESQGYTVHPVSRGESENLLAVADLNDDDKPDIVTRTESDGALIVYYQQ
jgi:hypothetical protein